MTRALAIVWLLCAVALSEWGLEAWLAPERAELKAQARPLAWIASLAFLGLALVTWRGGARPWVARLNLVAGSLVLIGPPMVEVGLRVALRFERSALRSPARFADNLASEDYWILAGRWNTYGLPIAVRRVHPELGWSQAHVEPGAPLGLIAKTRAQLSGPGTAPVFFYGDSYVAGISREENKLPFYLDAKLPDTSVLHLGVGGYGTGQMHLLFRETCDRIPAAEDPDAQRPLVIMGVMIYDFDRATLSIRSYQKPRLRVTAGGGLEVTNTPIEPDPEAFFRYARLTFRSYVAQGMRRKLFAGLDPRFEEKVELNRALVRANRDLAHASGADLLYVLFHSSNEVFRVDPRSTLFQEFCDELGVDCFDTRDTLLAYAEEPENDLGDLYVQGHHNDRGNVLVAEAILGKLRELGFR